MPDTKIPPNDRGNPATHALVTVIGKPKPRISQAERRAVSARKIIKATIRCLNRFGYGGTTVEAVLKEAGVSRGRLLHHFPSRTDLMIAVGRYVWELDSHYMRRWARQFTDPIDQLLGSVDLAWTMMSRKTGLAVLEILVASRSDPELAARFVPAHVKVQAEADRVVQEIIEKVGLAHKLDGRAVHHYIEACVRGLAIDRAFSGVDEAMPPALELVRKHMAQLLTDQLLQAHSDDDRERGMMSGRI
jgi:AcrR family transcriptional regulator